jgi:hypothetical protein
MSAQATVNIARNAATTKLLARVPPPAFSQATHRARCLAQLRSKHNNLEMYIYLNGLKDRDPTLFYTLLYDNMRASTPRLLSINVSYPIPSTGNGPDPVHPNCEHTRCAWLHVYSDRGRCLVI